MKIVIAGASGLVGAALVPALRSAGHEVHRLVRGRAAQAPGEIAWNPAAGDIDAAGLGNVDAFINLAGANLGSARWTRRRRDLILRSRVDATQTIVRAIARMARKPSVLLNASAVGFYGDRGDEILTEQSAIGHGFLPEVCLAWETHASGAARHGVRTALLRFGIILSAGGGALAKMLPLFRWGLGGRMGSGDQWMSWIAIEDVVAVLMHMLADSRATGPLNVVAPGSVTNAEFTRELARALRRPAILPVPPFALRLVLGRPMADEALLASTRAVPQRLNALGFAFRHPTLPSALEAELTP